jgi:colanic acid/amylovoran biosynthesis glycosyltransferase
MAAESRQDRYAALNDAAARMEAEWLRFSESGVAQGRAPEGGVIASYDGGALIVRRDEFEAIGGFAEGVLGGGEVDLCLRLGELARPIAVSGVRVGSGAARRLHRRHGTARRGGLRALLADDRVPSRRALPTPAAGRSVVVFTDAYPARSETFVYHEVEQLTELGWRTRVESSSRPSRIELEAGRATRTDYLEDDPPLRAALDLLRLAVRHPLRCLADVRDRRRWGSEAWPLRSLASAARRLAAGGERHIHVHFAAGAALHALRLARITGATYSVVGHGYDVFRDPRNLPEKLRGAAFVIGPSEYTARHLRSLMAPARAADVHVIVMGVDGDELTRSRPHPGGRTVIAIGRLVEKKGFAHLIEAAARIELDRVVIVGDGPLRGGLEALIASRDLGDRVEIVDAWGTGAVRELLEEADLLAMPSVIAADGDRDAMPVVVKEALAMEVPVVASDEVGLGELVRPEWGRLVPPADPEALAEAIDELLALPVERRAAMGAAGRRHVLAHCELAAETAKLARLIEATVP